VARARAAHRAMRLVVASATLLVVLHLALALVVVER
jgi:hypothetical protein